MRNGYKTGGNIKVVSIDSLKQLEVANKIDYIIVNMASACTREEPSFVSLDDFDNISTLLDEDKR